MPDELDPALDPLFITPTTWFEDIDDQYETAVGLFGSIRHLTPDAVTFTASEKFGHDTSPDVRDYHRDLHSLAILDDEDYDGTIVQAADETPPADTHAIWTTGDGSSVTYPSEETADGTLSLPKHVYIHERVPFDEEVQTRDALKQELNAIMDTTPDWDALFADTETVAAEH